MTAAASRRGFLAAFGAYASGAAAPVAGAVQVASSGTIAAPARATFPDAELIEAGRRWTDALAAHTKAAADYGEAHQHYREALGWCPPELRLDYYDNELRDLMIEVREASGLRVAPGWDHFEEYGWDSSVNRWDGEPLRAVLEWLPRLRGHAGRTPFIKRALRPLVPIAEARDAAESHGREHYRLDWLYDAYDATRKALDAVEHEIIALPAASLEGVAIKARVAERALAKWREHWPNHKPMPALEAVMLAALAVGSGTKDTA